jgi:hypothetical protein
MPPDTLGDDVRALVSDAEEAMARFGNDLARFNHLVGPEEIARFGKDLVLFNQLLALLSEHMTSMYERIDGLHRSKGEQ